MGRSALEGLEGVKKVTKGFRGFKEINTVYYDPGVSLTGGSFTASGQYNPDMIGAWFTTSPVGGSGNLEVHRLAHDRECARRGWPVAAGPGVSTVNHDFVNKVGTCNLAVMARHFGVKVMVAAPLASPTRPAATAAPS